MKYMMFAAALVAFATGCAPSLQSQKIDPQSAEKSQNTEVTTTTLPAPTTTSPVTTTTQPSLTPPNGCPTPVPGFTPAGTIRINGGALYTNNSQLNLSLSKNEGFLMKISNNNNCACGEWEDYATSKTWTIHTANAANAISVQYRDFEGVSHCATASITHDTLAPNISLTFDPSSEFDTPSLVKLNYSIDDTGSGYASHECKLNGQIVSCQRDPVTKSGAVTYNNQIKGDYVFTLTARDQLGQAASRELRWTITRDETPPAITLEFDPSSDFDVPSNVKLNYSVVETDSGVASHQCTLNGTAVSCPLSSQSPIQGSVSFPNQVKGDYVFIITVSDQIGNLASKDIRWTITKDETPPQISLTIDPSSKFEAPSRVKLNYTIDDAHSGYASHSCKLNNVTVTCNRDAATKSGSVTYNNQTKGDYVFTLTAFDQLGNSASKEVRWTITRDETDPVITLQFDPSSKFEVPSRVKLNYTIDDIHSGVQEYHCKLNGNLTPCDRDPMTKSGSVTFSNQTKGDYVFEITAIDFLGNTASKQLRWTITKDEVPPVLSLVFDPSSKFAAPSMVKLNYTIDDAQSGYASHVCKLNGNTVPCGRNATTKAGSVTFNDQVKGDYVFTLTALDQLGNSASKELRWTITRDEVPPTISLVIDTTSVFEAPSTVKLNYSIDDVDSGYASHSCMLNNVSVTCPRDSASKAGSVTYLNQAKGDYVFTLTALDQLGNSANKKVRWTITRDEVPPTVTLEFDPSSKFETPSLVKLNYTIDDARSGYASHECKLNSQATPCERNSTTKSGSVSFPNQAPGQYQFTVTAKDRLDNTTTKELTWTILQSDVTGPNISLAFDPTSKFDTPSRVKLDYTIVDLESGYKDHSCTLNGVATNCPRNPQNGGGNVNFNNQAIGDYVFVITARDNKNNSSSKSLSWNIRQATRPISQNYELKSNNKVDILMIIDNSPSMAFEQKNMAQRMSTFMTQIAGLDYKIAITTTDPRSSKAWGDGKFLPMVGLNNQYVVTPAIPLQQAQKIVGDTLQRRESGDSKEQAIYTTYRSIERSVASASSPNKGFFRDDASFAGIVISDEDESANGTKNQGQNLINYVKSLWVNKLFVWHSIITKPNDKKCKETQGYSYGVKYDALSKLTGAGTIGGAIIGSVCEQDYGTQLRGIGDSVQAMQRVIVLQCAPLGNPRSSVEVTRNGQNYNEAYEVQGTRLVFERPLQVGQYRLNYECL